MSLCDRCASFVSHIEPDGDGRFAVVVYDRRVVASGFPSREVARDSSPDLFTTEQS